MGRRPYSSVNWMKRIPFFRFESEAKKVPLLAVDELRRD